MLIVLDTNVLLVSISERSKTHWIYQKLISGEYELAVTNTILNEYQEKISQHWNVEVAQFVIRTLLELPNVKFVSIFFRLNLITADADDNAFVDCAFASNAHYIVSHDKHFEVLKYINFPSIKVIKIDDFKLLF
jgi:uncharacterized protein